MPAATETKKDPAPLQKDSQAAAPESGLDHRARAKKAKACLGVVRLDYDYPPAPGDIDHPGSFEYDVYYRAVPGLTFAMCQKGVLSEPVKKEFIAGIKWLTEEKKVSAITGDCGFMMWLQPLARKYTKLPVFLSSLVQLPAITCAYAAKEKIAIFTANGDSLEPMHTLIKDECGVETHEDRYVMVGCQDVPGFEAVALGEKVDVKKVTPGIVALVKQTIQKTPDPIRAILLECTELPPYSDAIRAATGLPVFDAITCANMFIDGLVDNPRFGLNDWHHEWDGQQEAYCVAKDLTEQRSMHER